jgi:hypothetical protein
MEESGTRQLQELLKRLGRAVHGAVVNSAEVRECLRQLQECGWNAVMLLEASVACREDGPQPSPATLRIHVEPNDKRVEYRIDAADADFLRSIGISPSRQPTHPSAPRRHRQE